MKYQEDVGHSSSPKTLRVRGSIQPNSITSKFSHESKRAQYEKQKILDILHPSSYFPKPGAATWVFKSPERITGELKRPITRVKMIEFTQNPEEWFFQEASLFQIEMVEIHNKYRANHDSPFLKLNQEMCSLAQKEAEEMAETGISRNLEISYGVNCFSIGKLKRKSEAFEACEHWYREGKKYKYDEQKQKNFSTVARFTQMIWAETKSLGVGLAKNDEKTFVVAFYFPKGNQQGKFKTNVLRPNSKRAEN